MFAQVQESHFFDSFCHLFEPSGLPFLIPIVAIIVWGILAGIKMVARHRERMAMIEHGIDPDHKDEPPEIRP
jgi:hypothetical protein